MNVREAAVAGSFYPGDPRELKNLINSLLLERPATDTPQPKALIVPHAGYVYSGPVAASAYRLLPAVAKTVRKVVLLGPAHRVYLRGMAVPSVTGFATPLGVVPLDADELEDIAGLPSVMISDSAHALEHSLEVHLPFLQMTLGNFSLIPIVVGDCRPGIVAAVIDALWEGDADTLVVVSSDLSHYLPYDEACARDGDTSRAIVAKSTNLDGEFACGAAAINGFMSAAAVRDLSVCALDVRNSGDTAGDRSGVVGYGAYALT
jgi:AmmeMemoRadiSam system protein B